jgi:hypothetical protein
MAPSKKVFVMVLESITLPMEMFTKVLGRRTSVMEKVSTIIQMEKYTGVTTN